MTQARVPANRGPSRPSTAITPHKSPCNDQFSGTDRPAVVTPFLNRTNPGIHRNHDNPPLPERVNSVPVLA